MPANVEIKARLADREAVTRRLEALATDGPHELVQHDSFFACAHGRLKLREFGSGPAQLIFYERPDAAGPKTSRYSITEIHDAVALRATLAQALGEVARVEKQRTLYLVGRTRVHLDRVVGLGSFLELEVVLQPDETAAAGELEARRLLAALGVPEQALVAGAYADLLAEQSRGGAMPLEPPCAAGPSGADRHPRGSTPGLLRQATRDDITALWRVRYAVTENTLTPGRLSDEDVRREIEDTGRGWVVVEPGEPGAAGTIVAFAICNERTGNLWALFVHPEAQGRGHGQRLHDTLLQWLRARGVPRAWLHTGADTRAAGFYQRRGWQLTGMVDGDEARYERTP